EQAQRQLRAWQEATGCETVEGFIAHAEVVNESAQVQAAKIDGYETRIATLEANLRDEVSRVEGFRLLHERAGARCVELEAARDAAISRAEHAERQAEERR